MTKENYPSLILKTPALIFSICKSESTKSSCRLLDLEPLSIVSQSVRWRKTLQFLSWKLCLSDIPPVVVKTINNRDLQHQVNRKPQTAATRLQFRVAEISNFSKAFSSVQFRSLLFNQNTIQQKNTYRNCKVAREPRRNQKAL